MIYYVHLLYVLFDTPSVVPTIFVGPLPKPALQSLGSPRGQGLPWKAQAADHQASALVPHLATGSAAFSMRRRPHVEGELLETEETAVPTL